MPWWYISFGDARRPRGQQFLGACLVPTPENDIAQAIRVAWMLGCNPGGDAQVVGPLGELPDHLRPKVGQLLQIPDLLAVGLITEEELAEREQRIWAEPEDT